MYLPSKDTEAVTLTRYLEMQLDAIRDAGHGLTDDQLRSTPLRSALSLAGLMKHAVYVMCGALEGAGQEGDDLIDTEDFHGTFTLQEDVSVETLREHFEAVKARYLALCEGIDPDAELTLPPMPWFGITEPSPANLRYITLHHVEELARHAGHADIIREEIDGAKAAELNAAVEGREANEYVTPWSPQG